MSFRESLRRHFIVGKVGYGDIAPKAQVTRFIMIGMIILAIALSPRLINGVLETYRTRKEGQHSYVSGRQPYVVVFLSYSKDQYIMDVLSACFQAVNRDAWTTF